MQHLRGPDSGHRGEHTCAAGTQRPRPTLPRTTERQWCPDGGRGRGRRRHLPGSVFSSAGDSRAGGPRHHLPPPPRPQRRLPTAHSALPTDTTAGVPGAHPPAAAARTTGRREGSGRKRTQSGPSALVRGPRISGTAASQSRGARTTGGPRNSAEGLAGPRTRPRLGLLLSTPTLPPRSTPGNGQLRGRGAPGGVGYRLRRTGSL